MNDLIKGKNITKPLYKVIAENNKHNEMIYTEGWNTDILEFNPTGQCNPGGIYFTDVNNIFSFLRYGDKIMPVTLDPDEDVYKESDKYKAHKIHLGEPMYLNDINTYKALIEQGADIHTDNDYALRYAVRNDHLDVVKYLVDQGANIHANGGCPLSWAVVGGHLDMVKYLIKQGADIHADNNYALHCADAYNHLDILDYLKSLN